MPRENIFLFGAGGHAKVVAEVVERQGLYRIAFWVDDDPTLKDRSVFGYQVLGGRDQARHACERLGIRRCLVAIGNNADRLKISEMLAAEGLEFATAIHPSAVLARDVVIGPGSVVIAGAVLNPGAVVGDQVIINTGATVDHDCQIGRGAHVAPKATLCGFVTVGIGAFIGSGATVIPNVMVGDQAVVGAGATVVRNVPAGTVVVGTPARPIAKSGPSPSVEA